MRDNRAHSARGRLAVAVLAAMLAVPAAMTPTLAADPDGARTPSGAVAGTPTGESVTLEGIVRVVIADDFRRGRSETRYALQTADGRVDLVVPDGELPALGGRRAKVTGTVLPGGGVRVSETVALDDAQAEATGGHGGVAGAPGPVGEGGGTTDAVYGWPGPAVRRVAVVIAGYTDHPGFNGTVEEMTEAMTGEGASVREYFEIASRGRVTVEATVLGPWALPIDSCPAFDSFTDTIGAIAARASVDGIDLARFDHVLMWTPAPCTSNWTALGEAPGQYIQMSAPYPDDGGRLDEFVNVAAHEMGHNMGLLHANSLVCSDGEGDPAQLTDDCGATEYGDPFSTMGGDQGYFSGLGVHWLSPLYDSSELAHLGWLDAGEEQVITAAGSYELVSTYAAGEGVRLLRIRRTLAPVGEDPSMGYPLRSGWLTIELRSDPPDGSFDSLVPSSPSTAGVIVRYVEDGYDPYEIGYLPALGSTYLVDAVPETPAYQMWSPEIHDAPLTVGDTLTDDVTGTEITLASLDTEGATVAVAFPGGPPPAAPVIAAPVITNVIATNGAATIYWSAPATTGTHPVEGYTVRSYPGALACLSIPGFHPRSCNVTGLANGTTYRFTVTAETNGGYWQMSLPSNPVTPVGPPAARVVPLATYRTTQTIGVAWGAHDDGQPVDSHDVRYRAAPWNDAFGAYTAWQSGTTQTSGSLTGSTGRTYCFSARATNDGVTGAWSSETCTAVPLDDRSLNASSAWNEVTGGALYRGTGLRTTAQGATASKAVEAKRIALVASTCSSCGSVKVYWKGELKKTISLKSSASKDKVVIPLLSFSGVRTGTLKLVVSSSGKRVQLDGLAVSRT